MTPSNNPKTFQKKLKDIIHSLAEDIADQFGGDIDEHPQQYFEEQAIKKLAAHYKAKYEGLFDKALETVPMHPRQKMSTGHLSDLFSESTAHDAELDAEVKLWHQAILSATEHFRERLASLQPQSQKEGMATQPSIDEIEEPTIEWLRKQINPGNSPLVNYNIDRLLRSQQKELFGRVRREVPEKEKEIAGDAYLGYALGNNHAIDQFNKVIDTIEREL